MDYTNRNWFGLAGPSRTVKVRGQRRLVRPWNCFRRVMDDGTVQGAGVLQVGSRHLLYLGTDSGRLIWSVGFVGVTP